MLEVSKFLGIKGQFGEADLISDLDTPIILKKKSETNIFADIIENYYNKGEYKNMILLNWLFHNLIKIVIKICTDVQYMVDIELIHISKLWKWNIHYIIVVMKIID